VNAGVAVETTGLSKRYRGTWALRDCRLTIPAGKIVALIGPNGAGKSTLLNILAGLSAPTEGGATILDGIPVGSQRARELVSFVAQDTPVYTDLKVRDHLRVARDLNVRWDQERAADRLTSVGIPLNRKAGKLSGGQQAQLALTLALARGPRLLLLDEPMARLDPVARHDFLAFLVTVAYEERISVLFSSHVLPELERIASYLVLLSHGSVQMTGPADDLIDAHRLLTGPAAEADGLLKELGALRVNGGSKQAHLLARHVGDLPAGWESREVTMEELVLGYLREPAVTAHAGPANVGTSPANETVIP
jgi:ABC-2 type transport system ATP-binding protein